MEQTKDLAKLIDHTCLKPNASKEEITKLAEEAKDNGFNSICIRANWVKEFSSEYRCSAVVDFPESDFNVESEQDIKNAKESIGNANLKVKIAETQEALESGALEIDPVIQVANIQFEDIEMQDVIKNELLTYFKLVEDFQNKADVKVEDGQISANSNSNDNKVFCIKPIFSCELLDDDEIELAAQILVEAYLEFREAHPQSKLKVAFKNSTGFIKGSKIKLASPELISKIATYLKLFDPDKHIGIKAAGGIKSKDDAHAIIEAADGRLSHIGTSSGTKLI